MAVAALMTVGVLGAALTWWLIRRQTVSIWTGFALETALLGAASLATGRLSLSPRVPIRWSIPAGVAGGAGFYLATTGFVWLAQRVPLFDRHVAELYAERRGISLPAAVALAAAVSAPGEELFWRGLFQQRLAEAVGAPAALGLTWLAFVAVYAFSANLPILAGAVVGGALWGGLALWTHGVLASILCHSVWTALMLMFPPGRTAGRITGQTAPATT